MFPVLIICIVLPMELLGCSEPPSWNYEEVARSLQKWVNTHTAKNVSMVTGKIINGVPTGVVWKMRGSRKLDGFLYGRVDGHGGLTGADVLFVYPDFETGLLGTFDNGELVVGRAVDVVGERCVEGVKQVEVVDRGAGETVWERAGEEMVRKHLEKFATVIDPYEKKSVYVGLSSIPGAGEGLFARRRMSPGDLVSYFGGWKTFHSSMVFNNMSLQEMDTAIAFRYSIGREAPQKWNYHKDLMLDIPLEYRSISTYRTTLGHKANHKFGQENADYVVVDHPVLGGIGGLVAKEVIEEDDEIFVDYRYDPGSCPDWYRDDYLEYNAQQKEEIEDIEDEIKQFYEDMGLSDFFD